MNFGGPLEIIGTLVVGAIAGYLASIVVGTNKQQGCIADVVVGVIGSIIGKFLLVTLFAEGRLLGGFLDTIIFATAGAVILLIALQILIPGRRKKRR